MRLSSTHNLCTEREIAKLRKMQMQDVVAFLDMFCDMYCPWPFFLKIKHMGEMLAPKALGRYGPHYLVCVAR